MNKPNVIKQLSVLNKQFLMETADPISPTAPVVEPKVAKPQAAEPVATPKAEPKATEPKEPKATEPKEPVADTKVTDLEALVAKLQADLEAAKTKDIQLKDAVEKLAEVEKAIKEAQVYKDTVANTLKTKLDAIPEDKQMLIPEGTAVQKLAWLEKAEKAGIFAPKSDPNMEIGKPFNPKTAAPDVNKLSPSAMLASYFVGRK